MSFALYKILKIPGIRFLRIPGLEFLKILGSRDLVGAWLLFTIFVFWMLLEIYKFLISNRIFIITVLKRTPPQMFFAPLHNTYGKMQSDSLQGYFRASIFQWFPLRSKQLWGNQACFCHQGTYNKNFPMLIQLSKLNNRCPMSHAKNDGIFNSRYNLFEQ